MVANSPMLPRPIPDKGSHRNEDTTISSIYYVLEIILEQCEIPNQSYFSPCSNPSCRVPSDLSPLRE